MTSLVSRNVTVNGRRTSVRLEKQMWLGLHEIARRENMSVHEVCTAIHKILRNDISFTASLRVFIMLYFKAAATETGHLKAGHGSLKKIIEKMGAEQKVKYDSLDHPSSLEGY